ncbi:unnamed protein product [Parascedosporium putredinis]|uniref:WD40 repeat-like protein n=1 Tax=Parascedosporium putredinis TaxID=1442378 RepID=A0A9P1H9U6_9PEZI|nr:unnamed protein product [Parascedosporium putredinis]CAI8001201.1 unnamed protein product [Parascedosporium putredinis]
MILTVYLTDSCIEERDEVGCPLLPTAQLHLEASQEATPPRASEPRPVERVAPTTPRPLGERFRRTALADASPANYRAKARALEWRSQNAGDAGLDHALVDEAGALPSPSERKAIAAGLYSNKAASLARGTLKEPYTYHVDFSDEEIEYVRQQARAFVTLPRPPKNPVRELAKILRRMPEIVKLLPKEIELQGPVSGRDERDLYWFLADVNQRSVASRPRIYTLRRNTFDSARPTAHASRASSLLFKRELEGRSLFGRRGNIGTIKDELNRVREDGMELRQEWTDCAGDIITISWVSDTNFICGTTEHSDSHNQQPNVASGENSTEEMRQSQDPWLYASVVSSDYDRHYDLGYTSSFDHTVKVWKVDESGSSMTALGTWQHGAKTSPRAAIGADDNDIPEDKRNTGVMRMFNFMTGNEVSLGIPMAQNVFEVMWHPTQPIFVVATSVGMNKAEHNVRTQVRVFALSDRAGSAISALRPENNAATMSSSAEFYGFIQILDCYSLDINELTIKPNSPECFYVTAAATDGKVYVWDTAQGNRPVHILCHGEPVEEYRGDREREDVGVKFTAWGSTVDRLYTGGSDGVVKIWNVRHKDPLVRDLLEVPGPVSAGAFSPDFTKLAIGDASGRVYLLSVSKGDDKPGSFIKLPGIDGGPPRSIRRPTPFIPHPEPPPPNGAQIPDRSSLGVLRAQRYLAEGQLVKHPNPVLGVFQGPQYASLNLYCREAHEDDDPTAPLVGFLQRNQQESSYPSDGTGWLNMRAKRLYAQPTQPKFDAVRQHRQNLACELDWHALEPGARSELVASGVDVWMMEELDYALEYEAEDGLGDEDPSEG